MVLRLQPIARGVTEHATGGPGAHVGPQPLGGEHPVLWLVGIFVVYGDIERTEGSRTWHPERRRRPVGQHAVALRTEVYSIFTPRSCLCARLIVRKVKHQAVGLHGVFSQHSVKARQPFVQRSQVAAVRSKGGDNENVRARLAQPRTPFAEPFCQLLWLCVESDEVVGADEHRYEISTKL